MCHSRRERHDLYERRSDNTPYEARSPADGLADCLGAADHALDPLYLLPGLADLGTNLCQELPRLLRQDFGFPPQLACRFEQVQDRQQQGDDHERRHRGDADGHRAGGSHELGWHS